MEFCNDLILHKDISSLHVSIINASQWLLVLFMPRLFWTALWFRKLQQNPVNTPGSLMTKLLYNSHTLFSKLSLDVSPIAQALSALSASIYKWSLLSQSVNTFYMSGFHLFSWMKLFNKSCPLYCTNTSTSKVRWSLICFWIIHQTQPELRAHRVGDLHPWEMAGFGRDVGRRAQMSFLPHI